MSYFLRIFILAILALSPGLFGSVGKVSLLKGNAYAQRESQKVVLTSGSVLEEKDTIITAKDAQMQIIFEDKTVITLGSESELKIEEYFNDATKPKAKFKFGEGSFKSITGQIGKTAPENFTLETKTATIGIRGTTIRGRVGKGGDHIACLSGTIVVRAIGSPNFVVVQAGKSTFVAPGTPPTPPQNITPQNGGTPPADGDNTPPPNGDTPPVPPTQDMSSITDKSNNDALLQKIQEETNAPQRISNTDFYVFGPFSLPDLYYGIQEDGFTVTNVSETLRYDMQNEVSIAKITGSFDGVFEQIVFQGKPSIDFFHNPSNNPKTTIKINQSTDQIKA